MRAPDTAKIARAPKCHGASGGEVLQKAGSKLSAPQANPRNVPPPGHVAGAVSRERNDVEDRGAGGVNHPRCFRIENQPGNREQHGAERTYPEKSG